MKKYISMELEVVTLVEEDIVTLSGSLFGSGSLPGDTDFGDYGSDDWTGQ